MKITKCFIGIFSTAFLMGYLAFSLLNFRNAEPTHCPLSKIDEVKEQTPTKTENFSKPKVFKLAGFFNEFNNQENKHLIEAGEVSLEAISKTKSHEIWLGLFGQKDELFLRQTKVEIKQKVESMLFFDEVSVRDKETPYFLVRNLKKAKAGKITTLFRDYTWRGAEDGENESTKLEKGFFKEFSLEDSKYTLRVEEGLSETQERVLVLLLDDGKTSQIIHYISYVGDGDYVGDLFWVGDLDSDGNLDLFMDFWNYEKGYYLSGLFLSSEAKKGKLVKRFEFLAYGGC